MEQARGVSVGEGKFSPLPPFKSDEKLDASHLAPSTLPVGVATDFNRGYLQSELTVDLGGGRECGGGKILFFFSTLPQNILVPPTPATGRRFPLLWGRKK
jgi:hypothetical protein